MVRRCVTLLSIGRVNLVGRLWRSLEASGQGSRGFTATEKEASLTLASTMGFITVLPNLHDLLPTRSPRGPTRTCYRVRDVFLNKLDFPNAFGLMRPPTIALWSPLHMTRTVRACTPSGLAKALRLRSFHLVPSSSILFPRPALTSSLVSGVAKELLEYLAVTSWARTAFGTAST